MRKFFTVVVRFFASIFAILFVLTAVLALLLSTLERNIFKAALYKSAFAEQQIYDRLPGILDEMLTTSMSINPCEQNPVTCEDIPPELSACYAKALGNERYVTLASGKGQPSDSEQQKIQSCLEQFGTPAQPTTTDSTEDQGGIPLFMKNLTASDWEAIIRIIIPPEDLQAMIESALDQVFAYLNGDVDSAKISLAKLKNRLNGPAGVEAVTRLILAQPTCTLEQLAQMTARGSSGGSGMVLCNPGEDVLNTLIAQLQEQLNTAVSQIPDEVTIIKSAPPSTAPSNNNPLGNDPVSVLRMVRLILRLSPLLPFGFLLLLTLFSVRSFKSWMRWWGIPFFFAGIIALGLGIAALPVLNWTWDTFLVVRIPSFIPTNIADIGHELARSVVHSLANGIILQALILTVIGLAAWIGSYFIKTKIKPQTPNIPPVPMPRPPSPQASI